MNKDEYLERSRKLRTPQRCPLVGYCERWAWTIYFFSYLDLPDKSDDITTVLNGTGDLPSDYEQRKILLAVGPPETSRGEDYCTFHNFCPEVPLFDHNRTQGVVPREAISSMDWAKTQGLHRKEHKHFSECLEYIQNADTKKQRNSHMSPSLKLRTKIMRRDGFKCVFCGKSVENGVKLEVDHIIPKNFISKLKLEERLYTAEENLCVACFDDNRGKGGTLTKEDVDFYTTRFSDPSHPNHGIIKNLETIPVDVALLPVSQGNTEVETIDLRMAMLHSVKREDHDNLMHDILSASIDCGRGERLSVAQILNSPGRSHSNYIALEGHGIAKVRAKKGVEGGVEVYDDILFIDYRTVRSKLLQGTEWENQSLNTFLKRIDGAKKWRRRMGGRNPRGIKIPWKTIKENYLGQKEDDADFDPDDF